jgi:hypothetical protein
MSELTGLIALLVALGLAMLSLNDVAASRPPRWTLRNVTLLVVAVALLAFCWFRFRLYVLHLLD